MSAKSRIERAALEVFVRDGVDAATTRAIAMEAGVSEGALYRHFRSKDELATGLFMATHRRLSTLIRESSDAAVGIDNKAAAIVRAYCQVADEDWLTFAFHLTQLHRFIPLYQEDGRDPVSVTEAVIKQAMITAELPPADPRVLAAMAIGIITQTATNKAYGRLGEDRLSAHAPLMTAAVKAVLFAR
ncbi:MAG: TetR/AcrR family transcriptional regulator [Caulobacteraceae bacterium]|jgi:AcrR family transcriptional regulator|nr:TetR/AcrR family transcriptional regulator [Caulobacteraceae bacterium]